ncbi:hypothetical protein ACIFOT_01770 [Neobacillus sp. NRS-1170]|uniref:hypothetical protein n=1 Tax=Neobacillus sp. NRS-1170 TaxID=3233898 RepID=UPI003D2AE5C4
MKEIVRSTEVPSNKVLSIKEELKEKIQQSEDAVFKELHTNEKYIEPDTSRTTFPAGRPFLTLIQTKSTKE